MIGHDVRKRTQAAPLRACLLVSASLIAATPAALAQAANDRGAPAQTYAQDFFTAFNPVTAEDMVRRIPGSRWTMAMTGAALAARLAMC